MELLDSDCNNFTLLKWGAAARTQFHMISRGDCAHHIQTNNFSQHPRFDFALQTKLNWSKNVRDERDCPFQIVLGAMNTAFCMLLSLAIYLEVRFSTFGTDSKFLFMEDYSLDLPDEELSHLNRNISRVQLLAPTQRAAGTGNTVGPIRPTAAQLGRPKCLHTLWVEYTHGIGGNKPAKDFTSVEKGKCKQKYRRTLSI